MNSPPMVLWERGSQKGVAQYAFPWVEGKAELLVSQQRSANLPAMPEGSPLLPPPIEHRVIRRHSALSPVSPCAELCVCVQFHLIRASTRHQDRDRTCGERVRRPGTPPWPARSCYGSCADRPRRPARRACRSRPCARQSAGSSRTSP